MPNGITLFKTIKKWSQKMHLRTQKFHKKIGVYLYVFLLTAIMNILPYKSVAGTTIKDGTQFF